MFSFLFLLFSLYVHYPNGKVYSPQVSPRNFSIPTSSLVLRPFRAVKELAEEAATTLIRPKEFQSLAIKSAQEWVPYRYIWKHELLCVHFLSLDSHLAMNLTLSNIRLEKKCHWGIIIYSDEHSRYDQFKKDLLNINATVSIVDKYIPVNISSKSIYSKLFPAFVPKVKEFLDGLK